MLDKSPVILVDSLTDFVEKVDAFVGLDDFTCFRGQSSVAWPLEPAILRKENIGILKNEKRSIRDLISIHPQEFAYDQTMFDKLVRMQHYGLPTRLLDVTRNPLVALYFSSESLSESEENEKAARVIAMKAPIERQRYFDSDAVSCLSHLANLSLSEKEEIVRSSELSRDKFNKLDVVKRLTQFIKSEKPYFLPIIEPEDLFIPYYVNTKMSNNRIVAQAGSFIIYGLSGFKGIERRNKSFVDGKYFVFEGQHKKRIRSSLKRLGIDESTLFPEIEKAARIIKHFYTS